MTRMSDDNRSGDTLLQAASRLDETLAAAIKDRQTVTAEGAAIDRLIDGVSVRPLTTHVDTRGSVIELFDTRWGWHPDPLVFVYSFTLRPGYVKGWNLHKLHEDRYVLLQGEMELVLYDVRPDSSTHGQICKIVLSEQHRQIVNIPRYVWHADYNIGTRDVVAVNFPTLPYDHADPDKYRLPIDTPLIPYQFADARGW
jgi:dTDP-4-dehydrorhamnose 3,5-epimerase